MDTFAEQLVKKKLSGKEKFKRNMILSSSIVLGGLVVIFSASFFYYYLFAGIVVCAAMIFGGVWFSRNMSNIEYEYSITNGEFDIDKIICQSKRKSFLSVNVSDFTDYGRYDENTTETDDNTTFILACDGTEKGYWYADFNNGQYGKSRLLFSPDEKIRNCIRPYLSSSLKMKIVREERMIMEEKNECGD